MQKMRKFLALVISVIMCASLLVPIASAADFSDVGADHRYYEAINYLASVGIINGFEDGSFKPEETVTRAQFAKIMAFALKSENIVATKQIFTDVAVDHWAAGNIEAMVSLGIINGMGDGTFAPESPVLYEQAVKMAVCALGYGDVADKNGGYPNGHLSVATSRGFIKGISDGAMGVGANRGLIAKLIDNMLGIDKLDLVTGEVKKGSSSKDDSGTDTAKGQVVAAYGVGLTTDLEDDCKKNEVLLRHADGEDEIFLLEDDYTDSDIERMQGFLGKMVNITYSEDSSGDYIITSITGQKGRNETTSLDVNDMHDYDHSSRIIEYYDEDSGDFEEISIAEDAYVIYNGKATEKELKDVMAELMTGDGKIDFLASNGSDYDVLFVKSYKTFIAGGSPTTSSTDDKMVVVYNKDNTADRVEIPKESTSKKTVKYTLNGNSATYSSITANSVVSFAISDDKTVFDVLISTKKESNVEIKSMSIDDLKITLGDTEYDIAAMFKAYIDANPGIVSVGSKGEFSLDAFGKVAAMKVATSTYTYGYVTSYEDGTGAGAKDKEPLALQIYVATGTKITPTIYGFKRNFYVNGVKYNTENEDDIETVIGLLEASAEAFVADGKMKGSEIETKNHNISQPVEFSVSGTTQATGKKAIDKLFIYDSQYTNKTELNTSAIVLNTKESDETNISKAKCVYTGSRRNFNGYYIDSTTKMIFVPEDKTEGDFYNRPYNYLNEGAEYNYQIFDASSSYTAGFVIVYATAATSVASLTYQDTPYIVTKTGGKDLFEGEETPTIELINAENYTKGDSEVVKGEAYFEGEETKAYTMKLEAGNWVKDKDVAFADLKAGDIVRPIINEDKTLADIEIVLQRDKIGNVTEFIRGIGTGSGTTQKVEDTAYKTIIGTAQNWDDGQNNLVVIPALAEGETISTEVEPIPMAVSNSVKIYVVDSKKDKENVSITNSKGDVIALNGATTPGQVAPNAAKLLAYTEYGTVRFIIVFK